MICPRPRVSGGSGFQNMCRGEVRRVQHTRPGSRERHTDYVCSQCSYKWSGEDFALHFAQTLQSILGTLRGGNADRVMESVETTMRLLRERKAPLASALADSDDNEEVVVH